NSFFCFAWASFLSLSVSFGRSQLTTNGCEIPPPMTATNLDGANASCATRYWSVTFSVGPAFSLPFSCPGARDANANTTQASGREESHFPFDKRIVHLHIGYRAGCAPLPNDTASLPGPRAKTYGSQEPMSRAGSPAADGWTAVAARRFRSRTTAGGVQPC